MRWLCAENSSLLVDAFVQELGVSSVFASLISKHGFKDAQEAKDFLYPKLAQLDDPFLVTHLREAAVRIVKAIEGCEHVCVMGDYDVDGVTSTVLLVDILAQLGLNARYFVPRRLDEGYGLSELALTRLLAQGPVDLLLVLDSGTNAVDEVAFLNQQGVEVIIIDHHRPRGPLPENTILINPHVFDEQGVPWKHLCTVGLVFKLVHALIKVLRKSNVEKAFNIRLKEYLDLVAMGTIADLMPLKDENRIFAKFGLERLSKTKRLGIKALFEVSNIDPTQGIKPVDVSFKMGPRINASGRIADASLPIEMLLTNDYKKCFQAAEVLDSLNRERQEIERSIVAEAESIVQEHYIHDRGIVLYSDAWHLGVVGVVAGRLTRKYNRPCIVLGKEGAYAKGSGRSVCGINLVELLTPCDRLLDSWGGHSMAIGISLRLDYLEDFKSTFRQTLDAHMKMSHLEKDLQLALWLEPKDVTMTLMDELELLQPFGEGNPEPVIGIKKIVIPYPAELFGEDHYRFLAPTEMGNMISGVAWKKADDVLPHGKPIDIAVKLHKNRWNGRETIQMELVEWKHI